MTDAQEIIRRILLGSVNRPPDGCGWIIGNEALSRLMLAAFEAGRAFERDEARREREENERLRKEASLEIL